MSVKEANIGLSVLFNLWILKTSRPVSNQVVFIWWCSPQVYWWPA